MSQTVTVAVVNDYDLVVAGLGALLASYGDRVRLVEMDAGVRVASDVDVILYDTFGNHLHDGVDIGSVVGGDRARRAIFSWNVDPGLVERAMRDGAHGYVSKQSGADELVAAIEAVARGERVLPPDVELVAATPEDGESALGDWPGRLFGLSAREAEVVALITAGLSNQEIADRSYLSINSVKTYIRTAYRKMGVERRSQAVAWGIGHGFQPDRSRTIADGT